jgi:hypothetical protein
MRDFVRAGTQLAGLLHRILDGLARLGLIPRELIVLAPYSIFLVLNYTAVRWTDIVRGRVRAGRIMLGLSAATRKMAPAVPPNHQYL